MLIDAALSKLQPLKIYGNDWPNVDGTCIRDFIHVMDLAEAHLESLKHLQNESNFLISECGNRKRYICTRTCKSYLKKLMDAKFRFQYVDRREGDICRSVADNSLILSQL